MDDDLPHSFAPFADVVEQIERVVKGEEEIKVAAQIVAGQIPQYYGQRDTAMISALWLGWMRDAQPLDLAFYQAGAIGWASRG